MYRWLNIRVYVIQGNEPDSTFANTSSPISCCCRQGYVWIIKEAPWTRRIKCVHGKISINCRQVFWCPKKKYLRIKCFWTKGSAAAWRRHHLYCQHCTQEHELVPPVSWSVGRRERYCTLTLCAYMRPQSGEGLDVIKLRAYSMANSSDVVLCDHNFCEFLFSASISCFLFYWFEIIFENAPRQEQAKQHGGTPAGSDWRCPPRH